MARKALLRRLGDIDLRLLRIFRIVADCGGLAASELELNIGRSTISKHVSDLETRLGMVLCRRGPAGFSVTPEGARVLQATDRLLAAVDRFQTDVDEIHENLTGTLRMASFDQSATNPEARVSHAIHAFADLAPDVALDLSIEPPTVIEAGVIDGRFDIGIVPLHRPSASLIYHEIYAEKMILYCGRDHPLFGAARGETRLEDLPAFKYAGLSFNSPNMVVGQRMKFKRAARAQDEEALALLILSGRYLGFLPDHAAASFVAKGLMRAVEPDRTAYLSVHAIILRKHPEPGRVPGEFLRCLLEAHGRGRG